MSDNSTLAAELSKDIRRLLEDFDEHKADDKKNFKYAHHMLENLLTQHARMDETVGYLRKERTVKADEELHVREALADMKARLQIIERLAWVLLLGLLSVVGSQLLRVLG